MSETDRSETFREAIKRYNALPLGRRFAGYVGAFGAVVCLVGIFVAYQKGAGFIVFLGLTFFLCLFGEHSRYAFAENLSQIKVRTIDYWYLSAATIGLFLASVGYSTQRDATIARVTDKFYEFAEPKAVADVQTEMGKFSNFLCVQLAPKANEACAGLKKLIPEVRMGRSPAEIASILKEFWRNVEAPYSELFSADQLSKIEVFQPVIDIQTKIENWQKLAELATNMAKGQSKVDEATRILLEIGEWIIWPFLLAYALALRITKVTIDVFEWAK